MVYWLLLSSNLCKLATLTHRLWVCVRSMNSCRAHRFVSMDGNKKKNSRERSKGQTKYWETNVGLRQRLAEQVEKIGQETSTSWRLSERRLRPLRLLLGRCRLLSCGSRSSLRIDQESALDAADVVRQKRVPADFVEQLLAVDTKRLALGLQTKSQKVNNQLVTNFHWNMDKSCVKDLPRRQYRYKTCKVTQERMRPRQ